MRDIKFRFWSTKDRRWVGWDISGWINVGEKEKQIVTLHPKLIDEVVTMQYTGLKDKNGVEIYEGDIIRWKREMGKITDTSDYQVVWEENSGGFYMKALHWDNNGNFSKERCQLIEVIGNIYENPELLE